jgi:hypothetical protein
MRFTDDAMMRPSGAPFAHLDLFAAATRARHSDPATSHRAAEALDARGQVARLAKVYEAAGAAGLTDEEAALKAGIPTAWKRCSDLRRLGLIAANGQTRDGSSGRAQRVCVWANFKEGNKSC